MNWIKFCCFRPDPASVPPAEVLMRSIPDIAKPHDAEVLEDLLRTVPRCCAGVLSSVRMQDFFVRTYTVTQIILDNYRSKLKNPFTCYI